MIEYLTIVIPEAVFVFLISDFISAKRDTKFYIGTSIIVLLYSFTLNLLVVMILNFILTVLFLSYKKTSLHVFAKTSLFIIVLFATFIPIYSIVEFCLKYMSSTPIIYMYEDILFQNKLFSSIIVSVITYSIYQVVLKPYKKEGVHLALYLFMYFITPMLTIIGLFTLQRMMTYIDVPNAYIYGSVLAIILFIMNITFVRVLYDKIKADKVNYELMHINEKSQEQIKMYNKLKKSNDDMLSILHDIKNHISMLTNDDGQNKEYINNLYAKFGQLKKFCYTNDILNIFLKEQEESCIQQGIKCNFHVDRIDFSFIKDIELITFLTPPFEFSLQNRKGVDTIQLTIMNHNEMMFIHFLLEITTDISTLELENQYKLLDHLLVKNQGSISLQYHSNKIELSLLLSIH